MFVAFRIEGVAHRLPKAGGVDEKNLHRGGAKLCQALCSQGVGGGKQKWEEGELDMRGQNKIVRNILIILAVVMSISFASCSTGSSDGNNSSSTREECNGTIYIIQIIQTAAIVAGVIIAIVSLLKDHKRRRYQTTVELYNKVSAETDRLLDKITNIFPSGVIDPDDLRYEKDKDLQQAITTFLSAYELISVGINLKILDLEVFMRMGGWFSIEWYNRLEQVIKKIRYLNDRCTVYGDFEYLVNEMIEKYQKHPKKYAPPKKISNKSKMRSVV